MFVASVRERSSLSSCRVACAAALLCCLAKPADAALLASSCRVACAAALLCCLAKPPAAALLALLRCSVALRSLLLPGCLRCCCAPARVACAAAALQQLCQQLCRKRRLLCPNRPQKVAALPKKGLGSLSSPFPEPQNRTSFKRPGWVFLPGFQAFSPGMLLRSFPVCCSARVLLVVSGRQVPDWCAVIGLLPACLLLLETRYSALPPLLLGKLLRQAVVLVSAAAVLTCIYLLHACLLGCHKLGNTSTLAECVVKRTLSRRARKTPNCCCCFCCWVEVSAGFG